MAVHESYRSPSLICAEQDDFCVAMWVGTPRVEDVRAMVAQGERGLERYGGKTLLANVIARRRPEDPPAKADFSGAFRSELMSFAKRDELHALATAHLVLAGGFLGAAVRTFLNTVRLVARPASPLAVFSEDAEAAAWLAEHGGEAWDPARVQAILDEVDASR